MRVFVANTTRQVIEFQYRVPESPGIIRQMIPVGSQIALSQDLTKEAVDYVVEQHARYGMIEVSEIDRGSGFCGTVYSVDKAIPASKIEWLMRHNNNVLIDRGRELRKEAAVSANNLLEHQLTEAGPDAPGLNKYEVSMVEENHDDRDEQPVIAEGIRVSRGQDAPPPPPRSVRRRR